jgi:hypothetical protein
MVLLIHACGLQRQSQPPRPRNFKLFLGPDTDTASCFRVPKEYMVQDYQKWRWSKDSLSYYPLELLDLNKLSVLLEDLPPRSNRDP